jgi:hypothetical protein
MVQLWRVHCSPETSAYQSGIRRLRDLRAAFRFGAATAASPYRSYRRKPLTRYARRGDGALHLNARTANAAR